MVYPAAGGGLSPPGAILKVIEKAEVDDTGDVVVVVDVVVAVVLEHPNNDVIIINSKTRLKITKIIRAPFRCLLLIVLLLHKFIHFKSTL